MFRQSTLLLGVTLLVSCTAPVEPREPIGGSPAGRITSDTGAQHDTSGRGVLPPITRLVIDPHPDSVIAGEFQQLGASTRTGGGAADPVETVEWSSSDSVVATITPAGMLYAKATGEVWIIALAAGRLDSALIKILPRVARIEITPADTFTLPGRTIHLVARLFDDHGIRIKGRELRWTSLDTALVKIDPTGTATPTALAGATIVAQSGRAMQTAMVRGAGRFRWISASDFGGCAGLVSGGTYCTGHVLNGTDGSCPGSRCRVFAPLPVGIGAPDDVVMGWTAGGAADCGLQHGTAVCWGIDEGGMLRATTRTQTGFAPPHALGGLPALSSITLGNGHACGLAGTNVWCWGDYAYGALGDSSRNCPMAGFCDPIMVPALQATSIAAGGASGMGTCAARTDGIVVCWGALSFDPVTGQGPVWSLHPVAMDSITGAVAVAATLGSRCALEGGGKVWCWGTNRSGELGDGTLQPRETPRSVPGLPPLKAITGASDTFCGLDLGGGAWCWGFAGFDGGSPRFTTATGCTPGSAYLCWLTPAHIGGELRFSSISVGLVSSCGMATDNYAYCWGGSIGLSSQAPLYTDIPFRVDGQAP